VAKSNFVEFLSGKKYLKCDIWWNFHVGKYVLFQVKKRYYNRTAMQWNRKDRKSSNKIEVAIISRFGNKPVLLGFSNR
jgi:hypothetical protein